MIVTKLQQFGARVLRAFTPIALSASLVVAGCETLPEPEVMDAPINLRASESGPSPEIVENAKEIAAGIVADEAFEELVGVAVEIMVDMRQAQQKLSDEQVDAIAITTTEPSFGEMMGPGALLGHLGSDPELLDQMELLLTEIRDDHGLKGASPDDVRYVFQTVFESDGGTYVVEEAVKDELEDPAGGFCEDACRDAHIYAVILAVTVFILEVAVGVLAGLLFLPLGVLVIMWAAAQLNYALALARAALERCLAACEGIDFDGKTCGDDEVCTDSEYCWKGVLGIGKEECRPKKAQGKVCSNDDHCQSGCCKLHAWTNPVSKTCRPASACN